MFCASRCVTRVGEAAGGRERRAGVCAGAASCCGTAAGGVGRRTVCAELGLYGRRCRTGGGVESRAEHGGRGDGTAGGVASGGGGAGGVVWCRGGGVGGG